MKYADILDAFYLKQTPEDVPLEQVTMSGAVRVTVIDKSAVDIRELPDPR